MALPPLPKNLWIKAGAILSLGSLVWSVFRGHRRLGRLSAGFTGAFFEKWDHLRLEKKVAATMAQAESRGLTTAEAAVSAAEANLEQLRSRA